MIKQIQNLSIVSVFILSSLINTNNNILQHLSSKVSLQQVESEYHLQELIYLEIGDGDNKIGILPGRSEEIPVGPAAIALNPNGQIYILDTVNNRVLEYKGENEVQEALAFDQSIKADSMAVSINNFYLNDVKNAQVIELTPENQTNIIDYSSAFTVVHTIYIDSQNSLFLSGYQLDESTNDTQKTQPLKQISVNSSIGNRMADQANFINTIPSIGVPTRTGIINTQLVNLINHTGMFIIEGGSNTLTLPIQIQKNQTLASVNLIDVDGQEYYYLRVEGLIQTTGGDIRVDSKIMKFDRNGIFITEIDLFDNSYTSINQALAINTNGDIYQLFTDTDGAHLLQWTTNPEIADQTSEITFHWNATEKTEMSDIIFTECGITEETYEQLENPIRATITRDQVISNAQAYRSHVWTVSSSNYYGRTCSNGCPVGNAKWTVGTTVTGVAYQWGGADSVSVFDSKLSQGYLAGDVTGTTCYGNCATGVDCSGFVSNTWQSSRFTTRDIGNIASIISVSEVKKGDAFNLYDSHVVLFSYFDANGNPVYYESQWDWAKVVLSSGWSAINGYTPYRYNSITDDGSTTDCTTVNYNGIILYADKTCNGDRREFNSPGFRNLSDFNDRTSSIFVGSGWSVRVYEHDLNGGLGSSRCITNSMWDLYVDYYTSGNTELRIEDTISAIDVYQNTSCAGTSAPLTPTNFRITGTNQNSISMAWSDVSNESGYRIYEWNGSNFSLAHTLGSNVTNFTDTGLNCDTEYFYELSAYNNTGESVHAGWISGHTTACPVLPSTPSSPTPVDNATMERNSEIQLDWETTGTNCSVHIWGGEIDINPSGSCSGLFLGNQWGGDYSWQVTATNNSGSTTGPVWRFKIKPYPPTNLSASKQSTQVILNWSLSDDEPVNIDGYNIYYSNGNLIGSVNKGVSNFTISGLTCNTGYSFFVRSIRQGVLSNSSNTVSITTDGCVPDKPSNFRISAATQTSLTLAWNDNSNESGYRIYKWNGSNFSLIHTLPANNTSFIDTGLYCETGYFYEVSAYNDFGESAHTGWIMGTTDDCATLPTMPANPVPSTNTILERISDTRLSWTTTGTSCNVHIWGGDIDINPSGDCSSLHLGEQRGGDYSWQVTATNLNGSVTGPVWKYKVKPYAPTSLTSTTISSSQINLSWTLSSDEPASIDGYDIFLGNGTLVGSVSSGINNYAITGLPCGSSFSFYVRSNRQGVQSNNSNSTTAETSICKSSPTCNPALSISINSTDFRRNDSSGYTNQISYYGNIPWNESGPEFAYTLTIPQDGFIIVKLSQLSSDLDIFVISDNNGLCSSDNLVSFGDSQASFLGRTGETYYLLVDGYNGAVSDYRLDVTSELVGQEVFIPLLLSSGP